MLSQTCLPHFTADTIELKESSITKMPLWYTDIIFTLTIADIHFRSDEKEKSILHLMAS